MTDSGLDFSQYGQPSYIQQFIPPDLPQWVIDVGAHDGLDGSNSREFIMNGWDAVLVEPLPATFATLQKNYSGMQKVRLSECACSNAEGTATLYIGKDGADGQTSSLCDDDNWRLNHGGEEIPVPMKKLTTVLDHCRCPQVFALLLVDAEGMDLEVLQGLDFERFRPAVICTEVYLENPAKDAVKNDLLTSLGYQMRGSIGSDTLWTCSRLVGDKTWPVPKPFRGPAIPPEFAAIRSGGQGIMFLDRLLNVSGTLTASGWGMAPDRSVPGTVFVGLERENGSIEFVQSARHPRSDVANHYQDQKLYFTGFVASWEIGSLPGIVKIQVIQGGESVRYENQVDILRGTP
jgi:FkbM family methyltransferase